MADALRYRAVQKIADGGSAEVFLAEQQGAAGFKRLVVLKRIRPELYADAQYREMLIEEAQLAMSLHHSNLVEVLDVGGANGRYFLVMELVDGWTLHQVMRRAREAGLPLPPELAVYITAELCRALAYAHSRSEGGEPLGIVHRDVCPNNVLISMHAEVKLTDFGIAKARTRTTHSKVGMIKGKPAYMSPEQARAEPLDARSDLFSVGTVLYSLLTDKMPFPGPSDHERLLQVANVEVPSPATLRPELPAELCKLVLKAMSKKREARFSSAQEFLAALEQVQRSALKPAGRSELENFLRTLSAKDGGRPISNQAMPPAASDEPEWIALSVEQAIVPDHTQTQRAVPPLVTPPEPARRRAWWPLSVAVSALLGVGAWWTLGTESNVVNEALAVDAGEPAPLPVPTLVARPRRVTAAANPERGLMPEHSARALLAFTFRGGISSMTDELDALARQGRRRLEKLESARRAKRPAAAPPSRDDRAADVIAGASLRAFAGVLAVVSTPALLAGYLGWATEHLALAWAVGLLGTPLGVLLVVKVRPRLVVHLLAQERARVAGLPFPVHGWFDVISAEPVPGRLHATLEFVAATPDDAMLEGLIKKLDDVTSRRGRTLVSPEFAFSYGVDDPTPSNLPYLSWQRAVLETVLLPLHREFPLASAWFRKP